MAMLFSYFQRFCVAKYSISKNTTCQPIDGQGFCFAFNCYRTKMSEWMLIFELIFRDFTNNQGCFVFFGQSFETGGGIHGIADDRIVKSLLRTHIPHRGHPSMNPDANLYFWPAFLGPF